VVHELLSRILAAPAPLVIAVVGLVVLAEDALFVGFVIPGETVAILGGVAASLGHVPLAAVLAVVVAAAVVGDTIGFEVGRRLGPRILAARFLQRHRSRLDEARGFLGRRGGWAVFLGRWTAFFRAVMPALAGTTPMSYRRFFVFNATGGLLWGVAVVLAGYLAGASYGAVEKAFGRDAGLAGLLVVAVVAVVWHLRRGRPAAQLHPGD
jgi:membrane protein DedA with SNARE-associated domain